MASRRRALADAERRGIWVLRGLSGLALALAVLSLTVAAGGVRPALAYGAIGLVLAGPLVRLAVPARRWVRPPDRRFLVLAAVVAVVLPVVAAAVTAGG